jgi:hypothetical protein
MAGADPRYEAAAKAVDAKKGAVGRWIVQAIKDVYAFVYTEVGTLLSVFKEPPDSKGVQKFSGKRVIALSLVADTLLGGVPATSWHFWFDVAKILGAVALYFWAYLSRT